MAEKAAEIVDRLGEEVEDGESADEVVQGIDEDGENGEIIDPPNFLIKHQQERGRGRVIQGIVKINYQHLQEHSMILSALCRSQGPEVGANFQINEARNLFQRLWPTFPVPHRNKFSKVRDNFLANLAPILPRTERTAVVQNRIRAQVKDILEENPNQSIRGVARIIDASRETVRRVARETTFPYKNRNCKHYNR